MKQKFIAGALCAVMLLSQAGYSTALEDPIPEPAAIDEILEQSQNIDKDGSMELEPLENENAAEEGGVPLPAADEAKPDIALAGTKDDTPPVLETLEDYLAASPEERDLRFQDPQHISDEAFYGSMKNGVWDSGYMNYDYTHDHFRADLLKEAEAAAQNGEYAQTKSKLLEYYRAKMRYQNRTDPVSQMNEYMSNGSRLMAKNFVWGDSDQTKVVGVDTAGAEEKEIIIDLTYWISGWMETRNPLYFHLAALDKDGTEIEIRSKEYENGKYAPRFEYFVNGVKKVLTPNLDTTISPNQKEAFGSQPWLRLCESESSIYKIPPYDSNTKQALIGFDINQIEPGEKVESAQMVLYARRTSEAGSGEFAVFRSHREYSEDEENEMWTMEPKRPRNQVSFDGIPAYVWTNNRSYMNCTDLDRWFCFNYPYQMYFVDKDCPEFYAYTYFRHMGAYITEMGDNPARDSGLDRAGRTAHLVAALMSRLIESEHMTPEMFSACLKFVWGAGKGLKNNFSATANSGVTETATYVAVVCSFQEFKTYEDWLSTVKERINTISSNLTMSDTSCTEVPMGYVSYSLNGFWNCYTRALEAKEESIYTPEVEQRLFDLVNYMMSMLAPGFHPPQQGDDGFYTDDYSGTFKNFAEYFNEPTFWYAATNGNAKNAKEPAYKSVMYPVGRKAVMRTGWGDDALYLQTQADGSKYSHGHADDLAVIVFAYGQYLLVDPNHNTYIANDQTRWLADTIGHNAVNINGISQAASGHASYGYGVPGAINRWVSNEGYDFVKAETYNNKEYIGDNLELNKDDFEYTRSTLFIKPNYWIVSDYLRPQKYPDQINHYSQNWHMLPEAGVTIDEATGIARTNFEGPNIQVVPLEPENYSKIGINGTGYYGSFSNIDYVEMQKEAKGTVTFDTVLYPENTTEKHDISTRRIELEDLNEQQASAMEITVKEPAKGTDFTGIYYLLHDSGKKQERKIGEYSFNGTLLYAETAQKSGRMTNLIAQSDETGDDAVVLKDSKGKVIYKSLAHVPDISFSLSGSEVLIHSGSEVDLTQLTVYSPERIQKVSFNGKPVSFKQENGYIFFNGTGILEKEEMKPAPDSGGSDGNGGSGGSGGSRAEHSVISGGGGGAGGANNVGGSAPTQTEQPEMKNPLLDELKGHWAEKEITQLVEKGIVTGDGNSLGLAAPVTRAEFAALLIRALGLETKDYDHEFEDVDGSEWYAPYLAAAYHSGMMQGDGKNANPNRTITREEMAKMLAAECERQEIPRGDVQIVFKDIGEVSPWAVSSVEYAATVGLLNGLDDGCFHPQETALREQAFVTVFRLLNLTGQN